MLKMTLSDCMQQLKIRLADEEEVYITLWRIIFCMLLLKHIKHSKTVFFLIIWSLNINYSDTQKMLIDNWHKVKCKCTKLYIWEWFKGQIKS